MLRELGVLGMLNVLHMLNMPIDAFLACWALFFDGGIVPDSELKQYKSISHFVWARNNIRSWGAHFYTFLLWW